MELIEVNNLVKDYKNNHGLFGINLTIKKGLAYGLVGTNGSGKTTIMRHLMGFLSPDSGNVKVCDLNPYLNMDEITRNIGYVPGSIAFPDVGTGNDFIKLQCERLNITDMTYVNYLIDKFKLDTNAPLRRMSKGMKQKTALVVAFMSKPDIYLLDEPSTGLDPLMRDTMVSILKEERKNGKTIFMSSHVFKEIEDICDAVYFIHNGKNVDYIEKENYVKSLKSLYKIGFKNKSDYESFLSTASYEIVKKKESLFDVSFLISNCEFDGLFKQLVGMDLRYLSYKPYTLEYYYNEIVSKKEI